MCKLCLCAVLIFTPLFSFSATLPSGYTQLEYIESTGTQHVDLGEDVYLQTGSIIEVDYQITADNPNQNEGWQSIYSNDTGGAPYPLGYVGYGVSTRIKQYSYYYNNKAHVSDSTVDMNRHVIRQDGEKFYRDGNLVYTHPTSNFTNYSHIWLFSRPGDAGSLSAFGKLYSAKIWSNGTNLSFDGVPAKRNSDGVVGLYDTVNNVFYTNSGTGSFIAGPVVDTCENPLTIMGTEICAENTQPSGTYLVARQNGNKYYINLSEEENPNNPKPITNESNNVLRIKIGNTIYNAHDSSVSE